MKSIFHLLLVMVRCDVAASNCQNRKEKYFINYKSNLKEYFLYKTVSFQK